MFVYTFCLKLDLRIILHPAAIEMEAMELQTGDHLLETCLKISPTTVQYKPEIKN